jgi:hypothetical protein
VELLPPPDEREALLDRLTATVRAAGSETFVAAPLVFADEQAFPDRYQPTVRGVRVLIRRVLAYAGLGELDVVLEVDGYADERAEVDEAGRRVVKERGGVAAWFAGIHGGACEFGVDSGLLGDPEGLVGVLAHEVAHAYRRYHGIEVDDHDEDERLTDLTTVFLGFGVLTTNAAQQHRSGGDTLASWWKNSHAGYLGPTSMAFLLAAQVVARDGDGGLRKQVAARLATNQRACFRAACEALGDRDRLIERLGLPPPARWPAVRSLPAVEAKDEPDDELDRELPDNVIAIGDARKRKRAAEARQAMHEADQVTFRVAMRQPRLAVVLVSVALGVVAMVALMRTGHVALALMALIASAVLGVRIQARQRDECSDPQCAATLPPDAVRCPRCRAAIAGRIDHRNQRLDAAEGYRNRMRR